MERVERNVLREQRESLLERERKVRVVNMGIGPIKEECSDGRSEG